MSYENIVNSSLLKFFCAVTEILNDYNSFISDKISNSKQEENLKNFAEEMSKKLLENFTKLQSFMVDTVKSIQSESSLSFEFSDRSDSPSPVKNQFLFNTPPKITEFHWDEKDNKFKTEKKSRIRKLYISNDHFAKNLFKL